MASSSRSDGPIPADASACDSAAYASAHSHRPAASRPRTSAASPIAEIPSSIRAPPGNLRQDSDPPDPHTGSRRPTCRRIIEATPALRTPGQDDPARGIRPETVSGRSASGSSTSLPGWRNRTDPGRWLWSTFRPCADTVPTADLHDVTTTPWPGRPVGRRPEAQPRSSRTRGSPRHTPPGSSTTHAWPSFGSTTSCGVDIATPLSSTSMQHQRPRLGSSSESPGPVHGPAFCRRPQRAMR